VLIEALERTPPDHASPALISAYLDISSADPALGVLAGHRDRVLAAEFSPDNRRIVTASLDHTARIWDAAAGILLRVLAGHTDMVRSAVFSCDGSRIATASRDKTAKIWDAARGTLLVTLIGHDASVIGVAFSPVTDRHIGARA